MFSLFLVVVLYRYGFNSHCRVCKTIFYFSSLYLFCCVCKIENSDILTNNLEESYNMIEQRIGWMIIINSHHHPICLLLKQQKNKNKENKKKVQWKRTNNHEYALTNDWLVLPNSPMRSPRTFWKLLYVFCRNLEMAKKNKKNKKKTQIIGCFLWSLPPGSSKFPSSILFFCEKKRSANIPPGWRDLFPYLFNLFSTCFFNLSVFTLYCGNLFKFDFRNPLEFDFERESECMNS